MHEYNLEKRDSTLWKIDWSNDCTYSLKYISGNTHMEPEMESFLKKHKMVYQIINVTNDYYVYNGYIDKISRDFIQSDTMWLHEKTSITNNLLFQSIANGQTLRKAHFGDTSKYAVVYVYRTGKVTNSMGEYFLYFDNEPMCVMKNKSGYMFKLFKEGNHVNHSDCSMASKRIILGIAKIRGMILFYFY
ncbi:hypothetical protein [Segetibacter koreensis]|uniref:hypothetical protein n=1 Tax=Segetibacter koreensis TaxID=398037 RepID=UPI00039D8470|nr:hypothetical protein [Segetibacter koreensis]